MPTLEGTDASETLYSIFDGEDPIYYGQIIAYGGNDIIYGGGWGDLLWGGADNDRIYGYLGWDTIHGQSGSDFLYGEGEEDVLYGEEGNDLLDGGPGRDYMDGGLGNDTYIITQTNESLFELPNEGSDSCLSSESFTLPANVEILDLTGSATNISGTGNNLANTVIGTNNSNTISGLDGNDILQSAGGTDTILGGNGNDVVHGGGGKDTLTGGSGADKFDFDVVSHSPAGTDRDLITDFNRIQGDKIDLINIDADLTLAGNQAFTQGSYVGGILTGDVIGGADVQIDLVGAPALDLGLDIIL